MIDLATAMKNKGLSRFPPVDAQSLLALQAAFRNPLPGWLTDFLATQDGMSLGPIVGKNPFTRERESFSPPWIASSTRIRELRSLYKPSDDIEWVAIVEVESELVVEFLAGPLKGYVVLLPHDLDLRVLDRSGSGFLQKTLDFIEAGIVNPSEALESIRFVPNHDDSSVAVRALGHESLAGRDQETSVMRRLATQMLSGAECAHFHPLLESGDVYLRETAVRRLGELSGEPSCRELLAAHLEQARQFRMRCQETLRAAGLCVEEERPVKTPPWDSLLVTARGGRVAAFTIGNFFDQRNSPDFDQWLLSRFERRD